MAVNFSKEHVFNFGHIDQTALARLPYEFVLAVLVFALVDLYQI